MPAHLNGGSRGWIVDLAVAALTLIAMVITLFRNDENDHESSTGDNTDLPDK